MVCLSWRKYKIWFLVSFCHRLSWILNGISIKYRSKMMFKTFSCSALSSVQDHICNFYKFIHIWKSLSYNVSISCILQSTKQRILHISPVNYFPVRICLYIFNMIISSVLYISCSSWHFFWRWKIHLKICYKFLNCYLFLCFCPDIFNIYQTVCFCRTDAKRIKKFLNFLFCIQEISTVVFFCLFCKNKQRTCLIYMQERKSSSKSCYSKFVFTCIISKTAFRFKIILPFYFYSPFRYSLLFKLFSGEQHFHRSFWNQDSRLMSTGRTCIICRKKFAKAFFTV